MKKKTLYSESEHKSLKDYPETEKPDRRCLRHGPECLSDAELLSVIIRTGAEGMTAVELCRRILESVPGKSLGGISRTSIDRLMKIRGIGTVKALQLKCVAELSRRMAKRETGKQIIFEGPDDIASYYMEDFRRLEQEELLLLLLNTRGALMGERLISRGTVDRTVASPREVMIAALEARAVSIVLLHNHPSGDPAPSRDDLELTERMAMAGMLVGVCLLDHIVIGDGVYVSLRREGLITENGPVTLPQEETKD